MRKGFRFIYIENAAELYGELDQDRLTAFFAHAKDNEALLPHGIDRDNFVSMDNNVLRASIHVVDPVIILHDANASAATPIDRVPGYSGVTII